MELNVSCARPRACIQKQTIQRIGAPSGMCRTEEAGRGRRIRTACNFSSLDMYGDEGVPFIIDFGTMADVQEGYPNNGTCPAEGQQAPRGNACASSNSYCTNVTTSARYYLEKYVCHCEDNYEGNPYVTNGCQGKCFSRFIRFAFFHLYPVRTFNLASFTFFSDIDECKDPSILQHCNGNCKNRPGGYDCPCKRGWKGDGKAGTCKEIFPLVARVIVGKYQV
jgi:hypothetical protein